MYEREEAGIENRREGEREGKEGAVSQGTTVSDREDCHRVEGCIE
jgi:hypothetical protein